MKETLVIIKPGFLWKERFLGRTISILEEKGMQVTGLKMTKLSKGEAELLYEEHRQREFFPSLVKLMSSSPIVAIRLRSTTGEDTIKTVREIIGDTDPARAKAGTIRRMYGTDIEANAVHGSADEKAAEREINFFFPGK